MKHLLRGAALVALFAISVPAWAQAPNTSPAGAALVALFAISVPAWAQAPNTSPAPPSSTASAASEKPSAAPEAKADTKADNWVWPRPHRQVRRSHRYARYRSPPYGSPHYWDRRWMSP